MRQFKFGIQIIPTHDTETEDLKCAERMFREVAYAMEQAWKNRPQQPQKPQHNAPPRELTNEEYSRKLAINAREGFENNWSQGITGGRRRNSRKKIKKLKKSRKSRKSRKSKKLRRRR